MDFFIDEFIKNHTYINYCEAIIFPDGHIEYAFPSHIEALIRATGKSRDDIWKEMPTTASPIDWLIDYTNCVAVWYDFQLSPVELTKYQKIALRKLKLNKIIK